MGRAHGLVAPPKLWQTFKVERLWVESVMGVEGRTSGDESIGTENREVSSTRRPWKSPMVITATRARDAARDSKATPGLPDIHQNGNSYGS